MTHDTLVLLELEGDFQQSGFRATLEIRHDHQLHGVRVKGFLPPAPELATQLTQHWQQRYRSLGFTQRIKGQKIIHKGSIHGRIADCRESAQQVRDRFRHWLSAESFQLIDRRLRENLHRQDWIRMLLCADDPHLPKLPWHEWDFFEQYPHAELAFSATEYESAPLVKAIPHSDRVRILAILGNSQDIDLSTDRLKLEALPQTEVEVLVEPDRQQMSDRLWEQHWDILFFAGHSETHPDSGRLHINQTDSLSLSELTYGLRKAIAQGLQLAIFNSCDGLGLAHELQQIRLPHMIVMREPVVDQVAHQFLHYFLDAFSQGMPLYLATRQARERLQGLEHQFPCASWLPVIYQSSAVAPPLWQDLLGRASDQIDPLLHPPSVAADTAEPVDDNTTAQPSHSATAPSAHTDTRCDSHPPPRSGNGWGDRLLPVFNAIRAVVLVSTVATAAVIGLRGFSLLESLELSAFDRLLRFRPTDVSDQRLLIVAITRQDIERLGNEFPISDQTLLTTLQRLDVYQPRVVGVNLYREQPTGMGWSALTQYLQAHETIVPICAHPYGSDATNGIAPPANLDALRLGFADVVTDSDGVVRRHLLAVDPPNQSPCSASYALSAQLALRYLEGEGITATFPNRDQWQLGATRLTVLKPYSGFYQRPASTQGHQILLNYRVYGTPDNLANQVTLTDVLTDRVKPDWISDKIVLIGVTDPTTKDSALTPYGTSMRGLLFHAQMVSQLVSAAKDQRPLLRFWPFGVELLWIWGWSAIATVVIMTVQPPVRRMGGIAALLIGLCGTSFGLLVTVGVVAPLVPAALAIAVVSLLATRSVKLRQRATANPNRPKT